MGLKGDQMIEEQVEKKPGRVKRFFGDLFAAIRCIFIVLLGLLLIGGGYFQAPWKVLALIAIILATLTIIPKRKRKWIWLTFGIVVIALVVWIFLPEGDGDWRPYTFDEELTAMEAKRAIPDDQNAATIYNQLIETYDVNDFEPDFMDDDLDYITWSGPWKSDDHPKLAKWIEDHDEIIELLLKACEKDQCRFPIYADPISFERTFEYASPVKHWPRLLFMAANNDLAHGRTDRALKKQLAILQIANHIYQQTSVIDFLIALAVEGIAIGQINKSVINSEVTEHHLSAIDKAIEDIDFNWYSDLPRILDYEKLFAKNFFGMFYQVNSEGKIRFIRNLSHILPKEIQQPPRYWQKRLYRALAICYWFIWPTTPQAAGKMVERKFSGFYEMSDPDYHWPTKSPSLDGLMVQYWLPWMDWKPSKTMYHIQYGHWLEAFSRRHAARIIVALRRYKNEQGRWPGSLEDVKPLSPAELFVDPTNNDSFVYKLTDDGFALYSKGKNGIDEAGEYKGNLPGFLKPDDILIWPAESRKAKEKTKSGAN
jgi:hypothetical protein